MESLEKRVETPRRSLRLQKQRAVITPPGPRELMKLNRSKQNAFNELNQITHKEANIEICIIPPTPVREEIKNSVINEEKSSSQKAMEINHENKMQSTALHNNPENQEALPIDQTTEVEKCLFDESIITIPESPPSNTQATIKDSTFSPEVDKSIKDMRPHIDKNLDATPVFPRNVALRTSTPLSQRVRNTPKLSAPVIDALKRVLSPKLDKDETFSAQFKIVNPLEKSILKKRKRSLSVGESFSQKKVMFVSPEVMNIDTIDEKMLQSFKEEKENSIKQGMIGSSGGGLMRKRSMSESGTPGGLKRKVPNFKAFHEQQFKKMESIVDYANRKAERAKKLITPSKAIPTIPEKLVSKVTHIPVRKPLLKKSSSDNLNQFGGKKSFKRSNSTENRLHTLQKPTNIPGEHKKALSMVLDKNVKKVPSSSVNLKPAHSSQDASTKRSKVEERREKNISLYKDKAVKAGQDNRERNKNLLKGVRLNRRFELQMQHRNIDGNEK